MRANSLRAAIAILVCRAATLSSWAAGGEAEPPKIEPDPQFQILVDRLARSRHLTPERFEAIVELNAHARQKGGNNEFVAQRTIVEQAAYYSAHTKSEVNEFGGGYEPRSALGIVQSLGIPTVREIQILAPYLDSSDEKLRDIVLGRIANGAAQRDVPEPNEMVRALLLYLNSPAARTWKNAPPPTIVKILYQSAPTAAFYFYVGRSFQGKDGTERIREMYWADHVIHDVAWKIQNKFLKQGEIEVAVAQLDKVSQIEGWWAKLYVVEMMRRHKEFRNEKILERLRKDPNPLVSKAANEPFPAEPAEDGGFFNLLR